MKIDKLSASLVTPSQPLQQQQQPNQIHQQQQQNNHNDASGSYYSYGDEGEVNNYNTNKNDYYQEEIGSEDDYDDEIENDREVDQIQEYQDSQLDGTGTVYQSLADDQFLQSKNFNQCYLVQSNQHQNQHSHKQHNNQQYSPGSYDDYGNEHDERDYQTNINHQIGGVNQPQYYTSQKNQNQGKLKRPKARNIEELSNRDQEGGGDSISSFERQYQLEVENQRYLLESQQKYSSKGKTQINYAAAAGNYQGLSNDQYLIMRNSHQQLQQLLPVQRLNFESNQNHQVKGQQTVFSSQQYNNLQSQKRLQDIDNNFNLNENNKGNELNEEEVLFDLDDKEDLVQFNKESPMNRIVLRSSMSGRNNRQQATTASNRNTFQLKLIGSNNKPQLQVDEQVSSNDDVFNDEEFKNQNQKKKRILRYLMLGFASIAVLPVNFCFFEIASLQQTIVEVHRMSSLHFYLLFVLVEIPQIFVPFIMKSFSFNLYIRSSVIVFALIVFICHLIVYIGISHQSQWLTYIGRIMFGLFSGGLIASIQYLFSKWQSHQKQGIFHLASQNVANIGLVLAIYISAQNIQKFQIESKQIQKTFRYGILLSILNIIPLLFCYALDKILNKIEDENFGILACNDVLLICLKLFSLGRWGWCEIERKKSFNFKSCCQSGTFETFWMRVLAIYNSSQFIKCLSKNVLDIFHILLNIAPFILSILLSTIVYFQTRSKGHRLKILAIGALLQFIAFFILLATHKEFQSIYSKSKQSHYQLDEKQDTANSKIVMFIIALGLAHTIRIALYPQIMPFVVKEQSRLESCSAFNQAIDHAFTALCLLLVGIFQQIYQNQNQSNAAIFTLLILLSITSLFFYIWFFIFDRYRKNSLLDLKNLGTSSGYVKENRLIKSSSRSSFKLPLLSLTKKRSQNDLMDKNGQNLQKDYKKILQKNRMSNCNGQGPESPPINFKINSSSIQNDSRVFNDLSTKRRVNFNSDNQKEGYQLQDIRIEVDQFHQLATKNVPTNLKQNQNSDDKNLQPKSILKGKIENQQNKNVNSQVDQIMNDINSVYEKS
eukprot:403372574